MVGNFPSPEGKGFSCQKRIDRKCVRNSERLEMPHFWTTYLVSCADGTWYCGVTKNLRKRIFTHNAGKGAKYTRSRTPVSFLAGRIHLTKSQAFKLEYKVKKTLRAMKIEVLMGSSLSPM